MKNKISKKEMEKWSRKLLKPIRRKSFSDNMIEWYKKFIKTENGSKFKMD